ncbi:hypothetical protein SFRURICE_009303, partial [Spodoptera frugiperda]
YPPTRRGDRVWRAFYPTVIRWDFLSMFIHMCDASCRIFMTSCVNLLVDIGHKVCDHRPASYATDFSLSCIETQTTVSTDSHRTDRMRNAYMRCVLRRHMECVRCRPVDAYLLIAAVSHRTPPR